MLKLEVLDKILREHYPTIIIGSKREKIQYIEFLNTIAKSSYNLAKDLKVSSVTIAKYTKKYFPDRPRQNTKLDNYILFKYGFKECKSCSEVYTLDNFNHNKSNLDGLQVYCKYCHYITTKTTQTERSASYRASKILRTPEWSDLTKIKEIYNKCPTGYHVDHIVPLNGTNVCGLHVEYNLQYLPARANLSKSNKLLMGQ